ncbi:MAG: TIGR03790 family protein [Gammaproteobacteria bacterium]|nr:TIGR03790 family protein [Gammaproteobacteria bacterium]
MPARRRHPGVGNAAGRRRREAEQTGLQGTIYLDARGIKRNQDNFGYGGYDESLRELAEVLKSQTTMPVVLDDQSELFQPGACPNAALYCGWYKLAHYVDAFDWVPGAVGYHIASSRPARSANPTPTSGARR